MLQASSRSGTAVKTRCLPSGEKTKSSPTLKVDEVGFGDLLPGSVTGGIALWVLQLIGTAYVGRVVAGASDVYGTFAVVFGLLDQWFPLARVNDPGSPVAAANPQARALPLPLLV